MTILLGCLFAGMPTPALALRSVTLAWSPSTDPSIVGYRVHYGSVSGHYSKTVQAGNQASAVISGLVEGETYYFVATSYNQLGMESVPSNETAYTVPGVTLFVGPTKATPSGKVFSLTSTSKAPASWILEASTDLKTWKALSTGTNSPAGITIAPSPVRNRFFRLKTDRPGVSLVTRHVGSDDFPNSFHLTTSGATPALWTVESSMDLKNWAPLASGTNTPVNLAVVMSEPPAMFFRLREGEPQAAVAAPVPLPVQSIPHTPGAFPAVTSGTE